MLMKILLKNSINIEKNGIDIISKFLRNFIERLLTNSLNREIFMIQF